MINIKSNSINKGDPIILENLNITRAKKIPILQNNEVNDVISSVAKGVYIYYINKNAMLFKISSMNNNIIFKYQLINDFNNLLMNVDNTDNLYIINNKRLMKFSTIGALLYNQEFNNINNPLISLGNNGDYLISYKIMNNSLLTFYNIANVSKWTTPITNTITALLLYNYRAIIATYDNYISYIKVYNMSAELYSIQIQGICTKLLQYNDKIYALIVNNYTIHIIVYDNELNSIDNICISYNPVDYSVLKPSVMMNIDNDNIYLSYCTMRLDITYAIVKCYNECLKTKWSIKIQNAIINANNNNTVVLSSNVLKVFMNEFNGNYVIYKGVILYNKLVSFNIEYPQLIGIYNGKDVDFILSECMNDLIPSFQYYLDDNGNITINPINNRYLGTAISDNKLILK